MSKSRLGVRLEKKSEDPAILTTQLHSYQLFEKQRRVFETHVRSTESDWNKELKKLSDEILALGSQKYIKAHCMFFEIHIMLLPTQRLKNLAKNALAELKSYIIEPQKTKHSLEKEQTTYTNTHQISIHFLYLAFDLYEIMLVKKENYFNLVENLLNGYFTYIKKCKNPGAVNRMNDYILKLLPSFYLSRIEHFSSQDAWSPKELDDYFTLFSNFFEQLNPSEINYYKRIYFLVTIRHMGLLINAIGKFEDTNLFLKSGELVANRFSKNNPLIISPRLYSIFLRSSVDKKNILFQVASFEKILLSFDKNKFSSTDEHYLREDINYACEAIQHVCSMTPSFKNHIKNNVLSDFFKTHWEYVSESNQQWFKAQHFEQIEEACKQNQVNGQAEFKALANKLSDLANQTKQLANLKPAKLSEKLIPAITKYKLIEIAVEEFRSNYPAINPKSLDDNLKIIRDKIAKKENELKKLNDSNKITKSTETKKSEQSPAQLKKILLDNKTIELSSQISVTMTNANQLIDAAKQAKTTEALEALETFLKTELPDHVKKIERIYQSVTGNTSADFDKTYAQQKTMLGTIEKNISDTIKTVRSESAKPKSVTSQVKIPSETKKTPALSKKTKKMHDDLFQGTKADIHNLQELALLEDKEIRPTFDLTLTLTGGFILRQNLFMLSAKKKASFADKKTWLATRIKDFDIKIFVPTDQFYKIKALYNFFDSAENRKKGYFFKETFVPSYDDPVNFKFFGVQRKSTVSYDISVCYEKNCKSYPISPLLSGQAVFYKKLHDNTYTYSEMEVSKEHKIAIVKNPLFYNACMSLVNNNVFSLYRPHSYQTNAMRVMTKILYKSHLVISRTESNQPMRLSIVDEKTQPLDKKSTSLKEQIKHIYYPAFHDGLKSGDGQYFYNWFVDLVRKNQFTLNGTGSIEYTKYFISIFFSALIDFTYSNAMSSHSFREEIAEGTAKCLSEYYNNSKIDSAKLPPAVICEQFDKAAMLFFQAKQKAVRGSPTSYPPRNTEKELDKCILRK